MRIRVLELPTQPDGERSYRTPWVLVIDEVGLHNLTELERIKPLVQEFGGEGVLIFKDWVALGDDQ